MKKNVWKLSYLFLAGALLSSLNLLANEEVQGQQAEESQFSDSPEYNRTCPSVEQCKPLMRKLRKYATNGSPKAQLLLAVAYLHGDGIEEDHTKAMRWIRKAAKRSYPMAKRVISGWYRYGTAGVTDLEKADFYLEAAAEGGDSKAQVAWGVKQLELGNAEEAELLFAQAADSGNKNAQKIREIIQFAKDREAGLIAKDAEYEGPPDDGSTVLTVRSSYEPIEVLTYFINNIDPNYRLSGSTGSRLSGVRCGTSAATSPCRSMSQRGHRIRGIKSKDEEEE